MKSFFSFLSVNGHEILLDRVDKDLGGYSSEVPPLPIPNREVKLANADGTAFSCGRVGSRLFKTNPKRVGLFFVLTFRQGLASTHCYSVGLKEACYLE